MVRRGCSIRSWGLVSAAAVLAALAIAPPAAADTATCAYLGAPFRVASVAVTPDPGAQRPDIHRGTPLGGGSPDAIHAFPYGDCGPATVSNTDSVLIHDASANDAGDVEVGVTHWDEGPLGPDFLPGFTDEPGESDEIEFTVSFGPGFDKLHLFLDPAPWFARFGSAGINLNALESPDDVDMTLEGVDFVRVKAPSFSHNVRADGGAGTGGPFPHPLELTGGAGRDVLVGGLRADLLYGNRGNDSLTGGRGNDKLLDSPGADKLRGGRGNDRLRGGRGTDRLRGGPGKDLLVGGKGRDVCVGGPGKDRFRGCERIRD